MAEYPRFGIEEPTEAAKFGRGMGLKTASAIAGQVGAVATGVGKYLKDKATKQRLVDEIVGRYKDAEPYRQQLLDLDPTTLGEKVYMMKTLEEKGAALKQQYPGLATPSPFMSAMNMPTVDRLKDWDDVFKNLATTAKDKYETGQTTEQIAGLGVTPNTTREEALSTIKGAPTEATLKVTGQLPTSADKEAARIRGGSAINDAESKARDDLQAANNSTAEIKQKKANLWKTVEAEKFKIEQQASKGEITETEKARQINSIVERAHQDDASLNNEIGRNAVMIDVIVRQYPHFRQYLSKEVAKSFEKDLQKRIKETQKMEVGKPAPSETGTGLPASTGRPSLDSFKRQ